MTTKEAAKGAASMLLFLTRYGRGSVQVAACEALLAFCSMALSYETKRDMAIDIVSRMSSAMSGEKTTRG